MDAEDFELAVIKEGYIKREGRERCILPTNTWDTAKLLRILLQVGVHQFFLIVNSAHFL